MRTALGVLRELHVVRRIGLDDVRRRERVRVVAFAQEVESWLMLGASPRATVLMARADAAGATILLGRHCTREWGMNRNETAQQYIARILAFSEGKDPRVVLASTAERLRALVASAPPDRWQRKPAPDKWSAGAVLAHLADAEIVAGWRVRLILGQDGVPLQPFDQEVWAAAFRYEQVDVHESLATFSAARASLLSLLSRVEPDRLTHHGMHAERGVETIAHLMRLYAGHDLNHLSQIERLVAPAA